MKHIFTQYKINLVKEKSGKYECENKITSPDVIAKISYDILNLDKECEEVLMMIALNTGNNIIGIFEVSRGIIDTTMVHPREIFKRLVLCNAAKFILIHNHPSGNENPSYDDINTSKIINDCANMMSIKLLDFCIVGNKMYSFKDHGLL